MKRLPSVALNQDLLRILAATTRMDADGDGRIDISAEEQEVIESLHSLAALKLLIFQVQSFRLFIILTPAGALLANANTHLLFDEAR